MDSLDDKNPETSEDVVEFKNETIEDECLDEIEELKVEIADNDEGTHRLEQELSEQNTNSVQVLPNQYIKQEETNEFLNVLDSDNKDNLPGTSTNDKIFTIKTNELLKIIQDNNTLQLENKTLKEEVRHSIEFQKETKKNFAIMQTKLDKIIEMLQHKNHTSNSINANDGLCTNEDSIDQIIIGNIKFPIDAKEQLDELEYKLLEKDVMTYLVQKFSETCGTSGLAKISKIGLPLMKCLIKDELLNQFTWKGIKGSTKMAFRQYVKIRELFYKVAHLADKSCSFSDSDSIIQHSAIKHSGQRMKRHNLSSESKSIIKKTKKELNRIHKDVCELKSNEVSIDSINSVNTTKLQHDVCCSLKNNKDADSRNVTENRESVYTKEQQVIDDNCRGLKDNNKNIDDANDENKDDSNTEKLQRPSIKKATDDLINTQNQSS